ncbi:serine hydrolase domain-containing protein [Catenuloplanes indicus]|uniref:CubicO group peptidase (Beta-lactamase class C family) n=1 Tax=Catenuloplanes indicus TaxID=137267 RepID=A0AAE3VV06_9ACTN|nr:serine hydrolase domain-containing protein [Catenuloplanes indicus]MDQ0364241.1 CubicO group peptidase (beta-lactamase class C family) [Catenuloplanes indicus]
MRKLLLVALALIVLVAVPGPAWSHPGRGFGGPGPAGHLAEPLSADAVDAYLRGALDATGLPGLSAVVTHGGQVVHATGLGRDSTGRPVTPDTPMRVASLSKSFTAAAVLSLVDERRVALDTPVVTYLPEFRTADPRTGRITVRHLLHHTSGLSDRTLDIGATQRATTLTGYLAALHDGTLTGEPGSRFEYCNVNYDVAARLVEAVDGRPFADALRARVFGPLGMGGSTVGDGPADGYVSLYGAWVPRAELPGFRGGAGGVVTTASDMGRWLISQAGHGPQVLTPDARATLHGPPPGEDYAMGWSVEVEEGRTLLVHSGNLFTYTSVQAFDPVTGHGFAVLTNSAALHDDTYDILLGLSALTAGRTADPPGGERQRIDAVLVLIAAPAAGLGILGALRSGRWACRRTGWPAVAGLIWPLLPVAVFVTSPQWLSALMNGRAVTWAQLTYFPASLTATLAVTAAAGLAVVVARLTRLARRPGRDR